MTGVETPSIGITALELLSANMPEKGTRNATFQAEVRDDGKVTKQAHGYLLFAFCCLLLTSAALGAGPDVQEIVRRSVQQNQNDWKMKPLYSYTEQDALSEHGKTTRREFRVHMIDGSPYSELIAQNGKPLPESLAISEQTKLQAETTRRHAESPAARRRRIAAYERGRHQQNALLQEMVKAFNFKLAGSEEINGHRCYILDAEPNAAYRPSSNETKVLKGMRGRMWIDANEYHWVKVQAHVFQPVSLAFFMAHVQPGTEFLLEKAPVAQGVWMPSHFVTTVRATALMLWSKNYTSDERYSDYMQGR